jgi:hypothetical protein
VELLVECESRAAESLDPLLSCSSADFRDAEEVGETIEDSGNASLAEVVQRREIAVEGCQRDARSLCHLLRSRSGASFQCKVYKRVDRVRSPLLRIGSSGAGRGLERVG